MYSDKDIINIIDEYIQKDKTEDEMVLECILLAGIEFFNLNDADEMISILNDTIKQGVAERKEDGSFIESVPMYKRSVGNDTLN